MYRNQETALRERIDSAHDRNRGADDRARHSLSRLKELNQQLSNRGRFPTDPPELTPPPTVEVEGDISSEELARLAETGEAEAARYGGEVELLERLVSVQQARLDGRGDHLPLRRPPRDVPRSYFYAEWFSPNRAVILCFSILVLFGGALAPFAGIALWAAATAGMLYYLLRARKSARLRMEFLGRCVEARGVRVSGEEPIVAGASAVLGSPTANGWDVLRASSQDRHVINTLEYEVGDGETRALKSFRYSGAPYHAGVVLHDPETDEALCVSQFNCRPHPDVHGRWDGGVTTMSKASLIGSIIALAFWFGTGLCSILLTLVTCAGTTAGIWAPLALG